MKVAIIGAGASGLAAVKCCIDEGITPVCYERNENIGGLWRYEDATKNGATVYKSTVINTSKEVMSFSDFPISPESPNFMHNRLVYQYFHDYAKRFDLMKHINFYTEVLNCVPCPDFKETGKWIVTTINSVTGKETSEIFNGVMVCIGHHANPNYPVEDFPGLSKFRGEHLHSSSYRIPDSFRDKKVLVIGIGNSGGDIAVELAGQSKQVFLSTRRGTWLFQRVGKHGMPGDLFPSRFILFIAKMLPSLAMSVVEKQCEEVIDHELYGLRPKHSVFSQHPTVNDDLPNKILNGTICIKGNVVEFTETEAIFEDGSREQVDSVIFATGYSYNFPFISEDILKVENNTSKMYKYIWPVTLSHYTLGIIGNVQPLGAINPIAEMQSRLVTRVIKGDLKLPPKGVILNDIKHKAEEMRRRYVGSRRHTIQVDYVAYMDELAVINGCKPNFAKFLLSDFALAMKILFGPVTSYQYRLVGPGKNNNARELIMTQMERIKKPLETRKAEKKISNRLSFSKIILLLILTYILGKLLNLV